MPRKSKIDELRDRFEAALQKGLESESAVERTAAIKATADMLNPNLTDLQKQAKKAEEDREAAESALKTAQTALDAANFKIAELEPSALRLPAVEAELADLRTNFDAKTSQARKELVEESQQNMFKAQRAENVAKDTLQSAQRQFSVNGLEVLMTAMRDLIAAHNIPLPDIWDLPKNVNPLFLTLWPGWTRIKAQIFVALTNNYKEPTEGFRQMFLRCLSSSLPVLYGVPSDPVEHRQTKVEVMTMMSEHWNIMSDIQREFEALQIERQAAFLRNHNAAMSAQEHEDAARGMGRTPISVAEPASITGCPPGEPHLAGCVCCACGGNGSVESNWSGFIPASPEIGTALPTKQEDNER
jgi:hypothetical protein